MKIGQKFRLSQFCNLCVSVKTRVFDVSHCLVGNFEKKYGKMKMEKCNAPLFDFYPEKLTFNFQNKLLRLLPSKNAAVQICC